MIATIRRAEEYKNVAGCKSKHLESHENGKIVTQFAEENNLKVSSISFDHRDIHKETSIPPDRKTKNQNDNLILIGNRQYRDVKDIQNFRGTDVNSDHFLVTGRAY
ncbi:hypothetical protein QE152_g38700 [Popillia japonica]|uniref:Uncharacterized protein n=1 Tax=Popillia japonica TaxID=7064 RepID=A0AAW1HWM0_POPJA